MKIICMDKDCVHNQGGDCQLQTVEKAGDRTNPSCIYYSRQVKSPL